ncbi:hypothetical protein C1752_04079 [Acaryochloris thomasi RCC1774]|uniref:Uncharacterized protein n=2 Tax=Acaryochloris TaxID=155977 RepID=A0A2W1JE62_9CYAN|nr:hypothetical protein C1752_04079 [Acaryochloris thomasi RCC1774]
MMVASQTSVSQQHSSCYTDEGLIQRFVDGFIQGNPILLSNPNLRTEPLFKSMQLIAGHDVIATAYLQDPPIRAVVHHGSPYSSILKQALLAENFYPLARTGQSQQYVYQYCLPPEGYELRCTTAKELWRVCWGRGFSLRSGIPLDLLVWGGASSRNHENWRSLRGIDCDQGKLQLKLLGGSLAIASSDLVVWAQQKSSHPSPREQRTRPNLRGYYRLRN